MTAPDKLLFDLFETAVNAANPLKKLKYFLPEIKKGKVIVIGAGKAAASMAKAVEESIDSEISGLVVTRYGHSLDCKKIKVLEASHPVPDDMGEKAALQMLKMVENLTPDDMVLCLISGGGSALLSAPAKGINIKDKKEINSALLKSGADISEMNCVRKHLSMVKGGRLATAAYPAKALTLLISDVPGDNPSVIASGPTVADETTCEDALEIIKKYNIPVKPEILEMLENGTLETPKPGDEKLKNSESITIATPRESLIAAAKQAEKEGLNTLILGDTIEGEAKEVAKVMAGIAENIINWHEPVKPPCVILSGGETTVTVKGNGRGGRNAEFLLGFASCIQNYTKQKRIDADRIWAIACDTDGIDGTEDNAGAMYTPENRKKAVSMTLNPDDFLKNNDGYSFFEKLDALIKTEPTLTNVNDFRAIYIKE